MSTAMHQRDAEFHIKKENIAAAHKAVVAAVASRKVESYISPADVENAESFEDALRACGWSIYIDTDGDVERIYFENQKMGDEEELFEALAPFVEDGSYIEMMDEDGDTWRWVFGNGEMQEVEPTISWPDGGL